MNVDWNRLYVLPERERKEIEKSRYLFLRSFFRFLDWLFYSQLNTRRSHPTAAIILKRLPKHREQVIERVLCTNVVLRDGTTENKQSHVAQHEIPNKSKQIPLEESGDAGLAYAFNYVFECSV